MAHARFPPLRVTNELLVSRLEDVWRQQTKHLCLRDTVWAYSSWWNEEQPRQGWKLHLSATILTANQVFRRAYPILRRCAADFKVPVELAVLESLNSGDSGYSQIGKFLTVYTRSESEATGLAHVLHHATDGLAAPSVPFDCRYRKGSLVYYRYGVFLGPKGGRSFLIDDRGRKSPDARAPRRAVPPWIRDPFRLRQRAAMPKAQGPVGVAYLVEKAIAQRGKGGVFTALDLSVYPLRWVIIKQGRRHGDTSWSGEDGASRVRRESVILFRLKAAGIRVPAVLRTFSQAGDRYLVLEKLAGRALIAPGKDQPAAASWRRAQRILDEVGPLLCELHVLGWVWRDCKPAHIFRYRGQLTLIDFEGACRIDDTNRMPWGSPAYVPPIYHGKFSRRPGTLEDDYALGVIGFQFLSGEFPARTVRARREVYERTGCPDALRDRIESLLQY